MITQSADGFKKAETTRRHFPETWLWESAIMYVKKMVYTLAQQHA